MGETADLAGGAIFLGSNAALTTTKTYLASVGGEV